MKHSHYYTNNQELDSKKQQFEYIYQDKKLSFSTDIGVFSKNYVDYGSQVLLNNVIIAANQAVLDVGCGYGVIGICLAKVYGCQVDMVDVNHRALELARENSAINQVQTEVFLSESYQQIDKTYDVIVTNPPIRAGKLVVTEILKGAYNYLNAGGCIYVVIQKKQGAPSAKKVLTEVFGNCKVVIRDKGYYLLQAVKD